MSEDSETKSLRHPEIMENRVFGGVLLCWQIGACFYYGYRETYAAENTTQNNHFLVAMLSLLVVGTIAIKQGLALSMCISKEQVLLLSSICSLLSPLLSNSTSLLLASLRRLGYLTGKTKQPGMMISMSPLGSLMYILIGLIRRQSNKHLM